jgi:hypothetical protein
MDSMEIWNWIFGQRAVTNATPAEPQPLPETLLYILVGDTLAKELNQTLPLCNIFPRPCQLT